MANKKDSYSGTTINKMNYYNDNNYKNNFNRAVKAISELASPTSVGLKACGGLSAKAILPFDLKSLKIDLFDNETDVYSDKRKFKVSLGLINHLGQPQNFRASMNGPAKNYKRGADQKSTHYLLAREIYQDLEGQVDDLRISKFYTTEPLPWGGHGRMQTKKDMSVIQHQTAQGYHFYIILGDQVIETEVESGRGVTPAQQRRGCVATKVLTSRGNPQATGLGSDFWNAGKEAK